MTKRENNTGIWHAHRNQGRLLNIHEARWLLPPLSFGPLNAWWLSRGEVSLAARDIVGRFMQAHKLASCGAQVLRWHRASYHLAPLRNSSEREKHAWVCMIMAFGRGPTAAILEERHMKLARARSRLGDARREINEKWLVRPKWRACACWRAMKRLEANGRAAAP